MQDKQYKVLEKLALKMRLNPTFHERLFVSKLKEWKIKFVTQKIVYPYIADFYLPQYNLIVEIDGGSHFISGNSSNGYTKRDKNRNEVLKSAGFSVLHITNGDIAQFKKVDILPSNETCIESTIEDDLKNDPIFAAAYLKKA